MIITWRIDRTPLMEKNGNDHWKGARINRKINKFRSQIYKWRILEIDSKMSYGAQLIPKSLRWPKFQSCNNSSHFSHRPSCLLNRNARHIKLIDAISIRKTFLDNTWQYDCIMSCKLIMFCFNKMYEIFVSWHHGNIWDYILVGIFIRNYNFY